MSKNRTLVLTVVRHGQTDSNKEKLMQGEFFHCKTRLKFFQSNKLREKLFAGNQFQQLLDELRYILTLCFMSNG